MMLEALRLGAWGAVLMTVATVTTNFVNIYMSSLALRSLLPRASDQFSVWSTGLIGAALSVFSGAWLDRYAGFMVILGGVLVPVGGILLARFYLLKRPVVVEALYEEGRTPEDRRRVPPYDVAGLAAWAAGAATYYLASGIGGTVPSLVVAVAVYLALKRFARL